jgi:valyl-tRNA synthetase
MAAGAELSVPIAEHVDVVAEAVRLNKELARLDKELERINGKLENPNFLQRAPQEVVAQEKDRHAALLEEKKTLARSLQRVESIGGSS